MWSASRSTPTSPARCGDQEHGDLGALRGSTEEAELLQPFLRLSALAHTTLSDEEFHLAARRVVALSRTGSPGELAEYCLRFLSTRDEHHYPLGRVSLRAERPCGFRQDFNELLARLEVLDKDSLARLEPPAHDVVCAVVVIELEHLARALAAGCRETEQPHCGKLAAALAREVTLTLRNGPDQRLEWRNEMRLVEDDQRILPEQARVVGPHPPADAVTAEEEPRPDHVHGPDHDCGQRGILEPLAVVCVLPAKCGDRKAPFAESERHAQFRNAVEPSPELVRDRRRLVYHRAAVHDVDQAPGQASAAQRSR